MWPNPQETPDLVTFTEEIRNGNFHFLFSDIHWSLCTKVLLSVSKFNTSNVFKKIYWISIKLIETKETQSKLKLPTKTTVFKIKEKVNRELALIPFCCVYFWVQPFIRYCDNALEIPNFGVSTTIMVSGGYLL